MAVTRIKNNQITDATIVANAKLTDYSISSAKLANNLTYNSDFTITGNLTVQGNATAIDTTITTIEDPVIVLASTQTSGSPAVDIGFLGFRGNQSNIAMVWDESADEFVTAFTSTGETNTTITISSYADFHTNNANVGGNLTIGGNIDITGNISSLNVTGNITGGNLLTPGLISATGNVSGGNITTAGQVTATGNVTGNALNGNTLSLTGNVTSALNVTGNIAGGNVSSTGVVSATGNVSGGNIATAGQVTATGNVAGGNLITSGIVSATGNITSGNVISNGIVSATGNINGAGAVFSGNVSAQNFIGNISGNIDAGGANTNIQFNDGDILAGSAAFTFDKTSNAVTATGNITGGNLSTGGTVTATGNVSGGNITTGGSVNATGAITSSANVAGANITTGGNVVATGNVSGGNITTAGQVVATGNVSGGNVNTAVVNNAGGDITISGNNVILSPTTGNIDASSSWINNVADPVLAQDAATKQYVDDAVSTGITIHEPVRLEAPVDIGGTYAQGGTTATVTDTIAGNTVVFSSAISPQVNDQYWFTNSFNGIVANTPYFVVSAPNTSAAVLSSTYNGAPVSNITSGSSLTQAVRINSGQGATLTNNGANVTLVIDGVTVANTNRVLIYQQANAAHNGVYVVSEAGNATTAWQLTRSSDMDTYIPNDVNGLDVGDYFYVQAGNTGAGESYVMTAPVGPTIIGYDNLTFTQFSASQVYSANTNAGLVLNGTTFSAKVDNNTTAFDGGGNIIVKASANLTTPNIGSATGTSLNVTGNVDGGNLNTGGNVVATGNVTGNALNGNTLSLTGNVTSALNVTGNIAGGNVSTAGQVTATGNIAGGNVSTTGIVSATGNVSGGNVSTTGIVSATGNVSGGNLTTVGQVTATGNINGAGAVFSGNVSAQNFIGNISGNIDAGGANTNIQFNDGDILAGSAAFTFDKTSNAVTVTGNITGANLNTGGQVVATGNVAGGNITTVGQVTATGNVAGGNVVATALVSGANVSAVANVTGANIVGTTSGTFANITISTSSIDGPAAGRITINGSNIDTDFAVNGDTVANVFYIDAGTGTASFGNSTQITNAIVAFNSPTSILMPTGNTQQRPGTGVTGMLRFNTTNNSLEIYDNSQWSEVGVPSFTVIDDQQFDGDGSTLAFTLGSTQTTDSCIVSINGVVQIPTLAYSVAGTFPTCVLTFTEAPASGDKIDVRQITTTTTVTSIANSPGNAVVSVSPTLGQVNITGNLVPTSNVTFDLGTSSLRWRDGYFAGNTITLGNTVIKNTSGNTIGFFGPDGTTPATIDSSSVDTTTIANGNSSLSVIASNGNIRANVGGSTIQTISTTGVAIVGDLSVTGNATLSGNILGDRIQNGTTQIDIQTQGGNANITIGGVANVAVFSTAGANITGALGVSGNITGANIIATVDVYTPEIIKTGSNAVGNIGQADNYFNRVFAQATSALYADLAEKYTADAEYPAGTVVCFGGSQEVTVTSADADTKVAGVVSTNPSYIMNDGLKADHVATVALTGRVPCRVTGTVRKGDLMVSAGYGLARAESNPRVGAVIGKALEDFDGQEGVIEVVVGRF